MQTSKLGTTLILGLGIAGLAVAFVGCASVKHEHSSGQYVKLDYPASAASNELQIAVTYELWIPDGVRTLRGIIVHQHGAGTRSEERRVGKECRSRWSPYH